MASEQFDAIIIGAGQSGGPLSSALGEAGWKTAIVERAHPGGTCVNTGCTPTKTMVASARLAYLVGRAADYGVNAGPAAVDLRVVRERKREIVEMFRAGSRSGIESAPNVDLIEGQAEFSGPTSVVVKLNDGGTRSLSASTIVINAGGRPRVPDTPELSAVDPLDSTSIMELDAVPDRLLIIGGGPIGLEFGQMFSRFGSKVTIIERGSRLLSREDADISEALADILIENGIDIRFDAEVTRFEIANGTKLAHVAGGDDAAPIEFDKVLVAAGRVPNSDALNLDAAGVKTDDRGYIPVDDQLRTNVDGIYALGDINGGPALTHLSYDDFRILQDNLVQGADRSTAGRLVPYTIFTDPQLGRIGMTEAEARDAGHDVLAFRMPMSSVARALEVDETRGLMKAVVDRSTGRILGASILGIEGGEIAGALQIAMMGDLPYTDLKEGIFSHPTLLESLNNLFGSPVED
ncbi:mercuric reductase [soil metagenome]